MRSAVLLVWMDILCASALAGPPRLEIPVRVHLLRSIGYDDIHCLLTRADVERIFAGVNAIWEPAGIRFQLESCIEESPGDRAAVAPTSQQNLTRLVPKESFSASAFNVYYVRRMDGNGVILAYGRLPAVFVKDTAELRPVPGGIEEPLPRVTAHELGHALGLSHRKDESNLMGSGTNGFALEVQDIELARKNASTIPWVRKE